MGGEFFFFLGGGVGWGLFLGGLGCIGGLWREVVECFADFVREIRKWRIWTTVLLTSVLALFFAGVEVLLILVIRGPYRRGVSWPVTLVGVVAAVLLIIGYVPVPFELWKRRGRVVGIDFWFLTIDWFGAFFSLMAIGELKASFTPEYQT